MQWTRIVLILSLRFFKCFAEPCAVFNFPNVHNETITLKDDTPVTLLFGLLNETCSEEDFKNFEIIVTKTDNSGSGGGTYCSIRRLKGECLGTEHCKCLGSPDKCSFSKEVDKSDKTVWVWSTNNQLAEKKEIIFNVEYGARINQIMFDGSDNASKYLVDKGANVTIVCFWEDGNPTVQASLMDRHGNKLESKKGRGQLRYIFPTVSCQDAGLIRCEAPGASENKSAGLLVRCPPELKRKGNMAEASAGEMTEISFEVRSHTREMDTSDCLLYNASGSDVTDGFQQCHAASLTGTPPDLTLTVQLGMLTTEDTGLWRLEVRNDVGTAKLNFSLKVTEPITYKRQRTAATTENIDTDTDGYISNTDLLGTSDTNPVQGREENDHANVDSGTWKAAVAVVAVVVILAFGACIVAVFIIRRRNRNGGLRRARRYDVMFRRRSPITSEHLYDDARPLSMPEEPAPMRPIPKPRRNRQVQISENRDYLSLVADNFDSFEDGNEQLIGSEQAEP